jgi:hypothetical protein
MIGSGMKDSRAAIFWAFGVALLVPVWMGTYFPTEDGFAHLAWTEVYRSLAATNSPWAPFYARSVRWNTPNLSYFLLQYALGSVVEPHVAQQLIISLLILAWVGAIHLLSVQLTNTVSLGAFTSLLLIHSSWLYGGYLSFLLGVPPLILALALVGRLVRSNDITKPSLYIALGAIGIIAYYCHLVAAGTFLLLIAIACLKSVRGQPRWVAGLALAGLPAALLVLSYLAGDSLGAGSLRWEPPVKTVERFVGLAFFRGFAAPALGFWLALGLFGAAMAVLCLDAARALARRRIPPVGRFVLVLASALAVLYVVSPEGVGDGYNLKGRFQLILWAWLLPGLPYALSRRSRAVVAAVVALLLAWQIADFSYGVRRFSAVYDAIVARARTIPPGSTIERELDYDHAGFERSFIRVLAHAPEDLAYHCSCVLIAGYHPSTPFYWVSTRSSDTRQAQYHLQISQLPGSPVTLTLVGRDWRLHRARASAVGLSTGSRVVSGR